MVRTLSAAIAGGAAALLLCAAPASAEQLSVDDPAGDAANPGLDVVRATLHNRDHALVVDVRFVSSVRGDLIVSVDPRGGRGLRLVSEHRPTGHTRDFVLPWAFTDRRPGGTAPRCPGFRVRWSPEAPTARLRLPSGCLDGGDYGAVRFSVLTERGADTDIAPDEDPASGWVPRG